MPAGPLLKASAATSLPGGLALPAGSQVTDATSMLGLMQARTAGAVNGAVPLPRDQGFWSPFGPGAPLYPAPLNQPNPRTGQADPRQSQYPVSYNILGNDRLVPWSTLRAAADQVDIIRLCLRTRKDELTEMEWGFGFTTDAKMQLGITSPNAERHMQIEYAEVIKKLKNFWSIPDRENDLSWPEWFGMLLEERFVLDATSIYPVTTYGNELHTLRIVDGATIKPLLNEYGVRPAAPAPAYQQWLYGFPRGEYSDDGASDTWEGTAGSLIYKPYTRRTQTPYGYPEVEQALVSAEVYLRRQDWMRQEYTSGTLPRTMLEMDIPAGQMTPEMLRAWQIVLNDRLTGSTQDRQEFTLLPAGFKPVVNPDVAERYKADYDEFLVKLLCAHMATQPSEIGFTPSNGLGGAGFSDGQEDVTYRKSLAPTTRWTVGIGNQISAQYLGMPPELTMRFLGMESEDEKTADDVADVRVKGGRMTLNEDRDRIGAPRYAFAEADMPMLMTGRGVVFLEGASETAPPGVEVGPPQAPSAGAAFEPGATPAADESAAAVADGQPDETQKAELAAFGRFLAKRGKASRPFAFTALSKADADELNSLAATRPDAARARAAELAKAADAGGRERGGPAPPRPRHPDHEAYAGYPISTAGTRP